MGQKIASFNVNSIKARLPILLRYLHEESPDLIALQECKCLADEFPSLEIQELGYHSQISGQKSYNGVAILSKNPCRLIPTSLDRFRDEARFLCAEWHDMIIVNIYAPNGNPNPSEKFDKKIDFMRQLYDFTQNTLLSMQKPCVILGDYNICPRDEDCFDPRQMVGDAILDEQARMEYFSMINLGLLNCFDHKARDKTTHFTYWDYQAGRLQKDQGVRIDHILANGLMIDRVIDCWVDKKPRYWERPSDHTPIIISIESQDSN